VKSLCRVSGSRNRSMCVFEVGVSQAESVACRCPDGEPEQVADASHIAAGEVQFLQDAVARRADAAHRRQPHRQPSSLNQSMRRLSRQTFRNLDQRSMKPGRTNSAYRRDPGRLTQTETSIELEAIEM
jgi:hypothetical protein